jgi:hypothetical protein
LAEERAITTAPWWLEMPNRSCVLDYESGDETISIAAKFVESDSWGGEPVRLRFRTFSVAGTITVVPPEVRLLAIVGGMSCVYVLRVIEGAKDFLVLDSHPLSMAQRRLRQFPRTPYRLGPCTAVVHTAGKHWRGLIEFHVHDVSTHGVGFTLAAGHRDRVEVGNYLRAPVTLPDGARSWIDGEIIWLTSDGRGGLLTRRAPHWEVSPTSGVGRI